MISVVGDIRRDSFIKSAKEKAMEKYGISRPQIFTGAWHSKKYRGIDFLYKKRFIFIDPSNKTFHWSKTDNIKEHHKQVKLLKAKGVRSLGSKSFELYFENDTGICVDVEDEELNNQWIKALDAMTGPVKGVPDN